MSMGDSRPSSSLREDKTVLRTFESMSAPEMWRLFVYSQGEVCSVILPDDMQKANICTVPWYM